MVLLNKAQTFDVNIVYKYFFVVHLCGKQFFKTINGKINSISPSSYSVAYSNEMYCWYTITSPENTKIRFWVDDFGTENFNQNYFYLWASWFFMFLT